MEIKTKKLGKEKYLLLRDNEAITILTDTQAEMAIKVLCKNRTLFVDFIELEKNKEKLKAKLIEHNLTLNDIKDGERRLKFLL